MPRYELVVLLFFEKSRKRETNFRIEYRPEWINPFRPDTHLVTLAFNHFNSNQCRATSGTLCFLEVVLETTHFEMRVLAAKLHAILGHP